MDEIINPKTVDAYLDAYRTVSELLYERTGNESPIAAFQFACTFLLNDDDYRIEPLVISHDEYPALLEEFFTERGSILFSDHKGATLNEAGKRRNRENYDRLYGEPRVPSTRSIQARSSTLQKRKRSDVTFDKWNRFLDDRRFGKFSIWLSVVDEAEEKWRFSMDFFLVLNTDIHDDLPLVGTTWENLHGSPAELARWRFKDSLYTPLYDFIDGYGTGLISKVLGMDRLRHATKAAISQAVTRNLSHNFGSHVLSRMANIEKELAGSRDGTAPGLGQYTSLSPKPPEKGYLSEFISYLNKRMDFLADITTGVPTIENEKWLFAEVVAGFDRNRLLADRISGVEDFRYSLSCRNYVTDPEGAEMQWEEVNEGEFRSLNDLLVSMPNDVLGCQAFYVILENLIRNCAKHSGPKAVTDPADHFRLRIDIRECVEPGTEAFYEVVISDNQVRTPAELEGLLSKLNGQINDSVLENDGSLRKGGWGLIEMDAAAAYLRKISVEKIDDPGFDLDLGHDEQARASRFPAKRNARSVPNILKAVAFDDKFLAYRLFLMKPREILVIDDDEALGEVGVETRLDLTRAGILLCGSSGDPGPFTYDHQNIYSHQLVVILSKDPDRIVGANPTGLSPRVLRIAAEDHEEMVRMIARRDLRELKFDLWVRYLQLRPYKFCYEYSGLQIKDRVLLSLPRSRDNGTAFYLNHAKDFDNKSIAFQEVKNSAVKAFLPELENRRTGLKFIESVHTRIVVLDERIQEYSTHAEYSQLGGGSLKISDLFSSTNICVPSTDVCRLSARDFSPQFDNILALLSAERNSAFFVIHLGVIEKMIGVFNKANSDRYSKDKGKEVKQFLLDVICEPFEIRYDRIILVSGRGTPPNLPDDIRYLNYSILAQYMIDLRFKYLLTEAVFSSRRISK